MELEKSEGIDERVFALVAVVVHTGHMSLTASFLAVVVGVEGLSC